MRYFDEGAPRPVPAGLTLPFEDHRDMAQIIAAEKRENRKKIREVKADTESE